MKKPTPSATSTTNGPNKNRVKKSQAHSLTPQSQTLPYPNVKKDPSLSIMTPSPKKIWTIGLLNHWTETSPACSIPKKCSTFHQTFKTASNIVTATDPTSWKENKTFTSLPIKTNAKKSTPKKVNSKSLNFSLTTETWKWKTCLDFQSEFVKAKIKNLW